MTERAPRPRRLEPRGLRREDAAEYVGVGASLFDEMVADGRMPRPFKVNKRVLWDRFRLDAAIDDLSDQSDGGWDFAA